ncbi:AraC family transcriptional regulator [Variovorax boronicumulans]|uniref:AraC family transcriptional regulator n=1 Tax=Variovorax boronicumulans TaxID=436515 RepID=A0A250DIE0_9BURK|nr:AraC family transcriptional regulator [Variovorax boronicumulans]ATA54034.1 AraC family transcriptional regulator [Variovorax boronicumulans]
MSDTDLDTDLRGHGGAASEVALSADSFVAPPATDSLRVDVRQTPGGVVGYEALPDHRLKLHAGAPVAGACQFHRFLYTRGDLDILPAGSTDIWHEESPSTSVVVRMAPALLVRTADEMGLPAERAVLGERHQFRDPQIEHIAWALDAERRAGFPNGRLYTDSLGTALAVQLIAAGPQVAPSPVQGLTRLQLKRVTEFIEAHLDGDLSLAALAEVAGLSASHLKTQFKRSTGQAVHAYVVHRRVDRARSLLLNSEMPASLVALESGFSHQSHMARCMRRVLGLTPGEVRRAA